MEPTHTVSEKDILRVLSGLEPEQTLGIISIRDELKLSTAEPLRLLLEILCEKGQIENTEYGYKLLASGREEVSKQDFIEVKSSEVGIPTTEVEPMLPAQIDDPYSMMSEAVTDFIDQEKPPLPLIAVTANELAASQAELSQWCETKIERVKEEERELRHQMDYAKSHRWSWRGHQNQLKRIQDNLVFYEKVAEAVRKGYLVIPNLPITTFAVRTTQQYGDNRLMYPRWDQVPQVQAEQLKAGAGKYVNPEVDRIPKQKDDKSYWVADKVLNPIFPVQLAEPFVIEETKKALALKIFDEVGTVEPPPQPRTVPADPIVAGRILNRRNKRHLTFFIAWWFNWEML